MGEVVGVDSCKGGWIALGLSSGSFDHASLHPHLADVLDAYADCAVVAVDIPIGLPSPDAWVREADVAARLFIGCRRSSVFMTHPRVVLCEPTHQAAIDRCRKLGKPSITAQAFALKAKILEADNLRSIDRRLHEVHPEVCFREMAGTELEFSKRTWTGMNQRRRLLEEQGIDVPALLGVAGSGSPDDVLDAAAAAWTAHRISQGVASRLPAAVAAESAIWY